MDLNVLHKNLRYPKRIIGGITFFLLFISSSLFAQTKNESDPSEHLTDGTALVDVQGAAQKESKQAKKKPGTQLDLEEMEKEKKKLLGILSGNKKSKEQGKKLDPESREALQKLGKGMKGHHESKDLGNVEYSRN